MIGIISEHFEESALSVMEWIKSMGGDCLRFNGEDLMAQPFSISLDDPSASFLSSNDQAADIKDIKVAWYRRDGLPNYDFLAGITSTDLGAQMRKHMAGENRAGKRSIYSELGDVYWLSKPDNVAPNKFEVLQKAKDHGILTPKTLVTNNKDQVRAFKDRVGDIIAKCIGDTIFFTKGLQAYALFTVKLEDKHIDALPDQFFPLLFQECITKKYEIRSFYLDGQIWSMAIFSQADKQTEVDFRVYNLSKPNRNVPYRLKKDMAEKVEALMKDLDLNTGSIDFICNEQGELVFLEVNPVGQFNMVSVPCNYNLEKEIARFLIGKDCLAG